MKSVFASLVIFILAGGVSALSAQHTEHMGLMGHVKTLRSYSVALRKQGGVLRESRFKRLQTSVVYDSEGWLVKLRYRPGMEYEMTPPEISGNFPWAFSKIEPHRLFSKDWMIFRRKGKTGTAKDDGGLFVSNLRFNSRHEPLKSSSIEYALGAGRKPDFKTPYKGGYLWTYDGSGLLVSLKAWNKGKWENYLEIRRDAKGRIIFEKRYDEVVERIYEYDSAGNVKEVRESGKHSPPKRYVLKYDSADRLKTAVIFRDGQNVGDRRFTYNQKGDLILSEAFVTGTLSHRIRFKYEYDAAGNWIRRIMTYGDSPPQLEVRVFTYQ